MFTSCKLADPFILCFYNPMDEEIPLLRKQIYTQAVTIRLNSESKKIRDDLRNQGINITEIERRALGRAYKEIHLKLQLDKAVASSFKGINPLL